MSSYYSPINPCSVDSQKKFHTTLYTTYNSFHTVYMYISYSFYINSLQNEISTNINANIQSIQYLHSSYNAIPHFNATPFQGSNPSRTHDCCTTKPSSKICTHTFQQTNRKPKQKELKKNIIHTAYKVLNQTKIPDTQN